MRVISGDLICEYRSSVRFLHPMIASMVDVDHTIELFTWTTPNGRKPAILLAELDLPYHLHLVNIERGDQKRPAYLELNPNGKIPTLIDSNPTVGRVVVFESGAILQYLADAYGRFLPRAQGQRRMEVLSWLFWQAGGPGPFFGQLGQFTKEKPHGKTYLHFLAEAKRLAGVLDARLEGRDFICDGYSIADIACYPWFDLVREKMPEVIEDRDNVKDWLTRISHRPAVRAGMRLEPARRKAA